LPNNEGTAKFTPNLNLLALLKFLRKKENKSHQRTTATYTLRLKVDLYSITKTLISIIVQDFSLSSGAWVAAPSNIDITDTRIAFVKFTVINPNAFPIFIDNWKIEEKGKVVIQENHYDPYGFELYGLDKKGNPEHDYQYNGKEHLTDLGLEWDDYGVRTRDRQLHIWGQVDQLSDTQESFSPYHFTYNNPILYNDPTGMVGENVNENNHISTWVNDKKNNRWLWIDDGYHFTFEVSPEEFDKIERAGSIKNAGGEVYNRWFWRAVLEELKGNPGKSEVDKFVQSWYYDIWAETAIGIYDGNYSNAALNIGSGTLKNLKKFARYIIGTGQVHKRDIKLRMR
jgi:RHS repeat-associated protein